jgi:hypothetical protein
MARSPKKNNKKSSSLADRFDAFRASLTASGPRFSAIAAVAFLLVCGALVWWGVPRLRARLDSSTLPESGAVVVDYTAAPSWFDGLRREEVSKQVERAVGSASSFDPHRLAKAKDALMTTGWFRAVEQVTLTDNGGFLVDATFVEPFAVVRHAEQDYLVDRGGRLLPMQWPAGHRPASPHYVAIVGAQQAPRGEYGEPWPGKDVAAGLALATELGPKRWFPLVAGIDVSQFGDGADSTASMLSLITARGGRLVWGRGPDSRTAAEVPTETKLQTLDFLFAKFGQLDNGGGRTLDLRGDVVTQLSAPQVASGADASDADESSDARAQN